MLNKKEFRQKISKINKDNINKDFSVEDSIILEKVKNCDNFKAAKTVLLFYPFPNEVNVSALIDYCLQQGKKVGLPKTYKEEIKFFYITKDWKNDLTQGVFNTIEPKSENQIKFFDKESVVIVPSLALAKDKSRIGHGKGYYDKFLSLNKELFKIGICRKHLLFNSIPTNGNDIKMDLIISSN
ncbi:MAG: 5-formyltetrahydrofolate cyclo-ligase [Sphaerochaetaceae bacterium]|nr:5-formyltetrahydrofolate cyclo-ligase [Sphaerochaetaceae bacterium]